MNRRKFITACTCCASFCTLKGIAAHLTDGFIEADINREKYILKESRKDYTSPRDLLHIGIHLTEHCNLSCKYCSHFSSIASKEFYDVKKYKKDMKRLSDITEHKMISIHLLGGEPLLHPKINDFFRITRKYFPNTKIGLITNCTLLDSMDKSFYRAMKKNSIHLIPSIYPIEINRESIYKKIDKYEICVEKTRPIKTFDKLTLDLSGRQKENSFCRARGTQNRYINGKLYPCFVIANIRHFNKRFNQNIPVTNEDYLDIYNVQDAQEIIDFLNKPKPFCKYCKDHFINKVPWELTKTHSISEWT